MTTSHEDPHAIIFLLIANARLQTLLLCRW